MFKQRMKTSIITSILLGFLCVLVFIFREGFSNNQYYILALWYNRILMGVVIGLAAQRTGIKVLFRGALLGLLVSLAFFLSTELYDIYTFVAGIVIGIIIDGMASQYSNFITRRLRKIINKITEKNNSTY